MRKIIVLNGYAGVGKNAFVSACGLHINVQHISSVDQIKRIATIMGWEQEKNKKTRKFLSDLKNIHTEYNNGPLNYVLKQIKFFVNSNDPEDSILFIDIREPEEIIKLIKHCDQKIETVLVINNNVTHLCSNSADLNVFNFKYDWIVDNQKSLQDLEETAKTFVKRINQDKDAVDEDAYLL